MLSALLRLTSYTKCHVIVADASRADITTSPHRRRLCLFRRSNSLTSANVVISPRRSYDFFDLNITRQMLQDFLCVNDLESIFRLRPDRIRCLIILCFHRYPFMMSMRVCSADVQWRRQL